VNGRKERRRMRKKVAEKEKRIGGLPVFEEDEGGV